MPAITAPTIANQRIYVTAFHIRLLIQNINFKRMNPSRIINTILIYGMSVIYQVDMSNQINLGYFHRPFILPFFASSTPFFCMEPSSKHKATHQETVAILPIPSHRKIQE